MEILIIPSGHFPITNEHSGAIEKLINMYLIENEKFSNNITVYSPIIKNIEQDNQIYKHTTFVFIDKTKFFFKIKRIFFGVINKFCKKYVPNAYIREVVRKIKKDDINKFDKIVFENGQNYIPYFCKKLKPKCDIFLHLHNDYINIEDYYNSKNILNYCKKVLAVSDFIKNRVNEIEKDKAVTLYNAINLNKFEKKLSCDERKKYCDKYDLNGKLVFIYVGRLMQEKGVKELIQAFNLLNDNNTKLLIVGGSRQLKNMNAYINELHKLAADNSNVEFVGFVNESELYKYYQLADYQFIPSLWNEAFGLIALEGMASNIKIIASNSGGLKEILEDTCIYVERKNIVSNLYKVMRNITLSKLEFNKLNKYGSIINKFSVNSYCNGFFEKIK